MAVNEPSKRTEPLAHGPPVNSGSGPFYDAFVVRLWHLGTGQLLRAEVGHVQTGSISNGEGLRRPGSSAVSASASTAGSRPAAARRSGALKARDRP